MGIKRPLMILGSTVGAVAAVLSYHPAAGGSTMPLANAPEVPVDAATATPTTTPTTTPSPTASAEASAAPVQTESAAPAQKTQKTQKAQSKKSTSTGTATKKKQPAPDASASADLAPTPAPAPDPTPVSKVAKDQTVTGATAQTRWGPVQVQITVKDGKIVDAVGLQYPNGDRRSQWISDQAIPWLVEETLQEQSANVQIIGGATYTSNGWRQSLASAMQKAGL